MDKRTLLAIVLSLIVLMLWQTFFLPTPPVPESSAGTASPTGSPVATSLGKPVPTLTHAPEATESSAPSLPSSAAWQKAIPEQEAVIERSEFRAVFTNEGGGIRSWTRKDYTEYQPGVGPLDVFRNLVSSKPILPENDTNLDLLGGPYRNSTPFRFDGDVVSHEKESRCRLTEHTDSQVRFLCREGSVEISKDYSVGDDPNLVHLAVTITNRGPKAVSSTPAMGIRGWAPAKKRRTFAPTSVPIYHIDGEVERVDLDDVKEHALVVEGKVEWAGIDDKYFLRALVPSDVKKAAVSVGGGEPTNVGGTGEGSDASARIPLLVGLQGKRLMLTPGQSAHLEYDLFLGPKRSEILKQYDRDLEDSLNFGIFGVFAEPILALLKWIYRHVGSYGVAIILLTIIIKTLFYPLMVKQMESAARMKEFQPQMAEIREKYKDDKERLNQEMMRFMQEKKINPLGGCLPLLLQMPIWFALYRVLQNSIELYHTPFLYLPDLSERDPFGISPLILGVLMYVQQRMTPQAPGMDPMQAKMMQFLPLVFAVIMFTLPSGLVVYILVNTILTIIQQAVITRRTAAASSK